MKEEAGVAETWALLDKLPPVGNPGITKVIRERERVISIKVMLRRKRISTILYKSTTHYTKAAGGRGAGS